jgi:hypothetical protein
MEVTMCFVVIKIWLNIVMRVLICVGTPTFGVCSVVHVFRCKKHIDILICLVLEHPLRYKKLVAIAQ